MKITKERNPYLRRVASDNPHKYSYDISSGKYHLLSADGSQTVINKTGTYDPKFRKDFTGFATPQLRYQAAKHDQTALHYTPDLSYRKKNSYYTPITKKFMGYAQQPYRLKGKKFPQFLTKAEQPHQFKGARSLTKSQSQNKQKLKTRDRNNISLILANSANTFIGKDINDQYYQTSFGNMTQSKPLPKFAKKTCYNYRCKYQKHFVFDEKGKTEESTRFTYTRTTNENILSRSFYDKHFDMEKKQFACMESQVA